MGTRGRRSRGVSPVPRVTIRLPAALRSHADGRSTVAVEAETAGEALREVGRLSPGLEAHLFDERGELRSSVKVYAGDTELGPLGGSERRLEDGEELMVVPAISGG